VHPVGMTGRPHKLLTGRSNAHLRSGQLESASVHVRAGVWVKLSILMPVYNEEDRLGEALKQSLAVDYPCETELVVVNIHHDHNQGKGAAIRTAVDSATGDYMVILDADLEYDPSDIPRLLQPVLSGKATVVYGNRTFGGHAAYSFWYVMGNKGVTLAANILFNSYIGDLETCYKLMPIALYRSLDVRSHGFGMEAEVTGKLLRRRIRPYEIPISYTARTREEGKKITWKDGVQALWILARERIRRAQPKA
jgi:hypothetical protein